MATSSMTEPKTPQKSLKRTSNAAAKFIIDLTECADEPYASPDAPKKKKKRIAHQAFNEVYKFPPTTQSAKQQKTEYDFDAVGVFMTGKGNIYIQNGRRTKKLQNQSHSSLNDRFEELLSHGLAEAKTVRIHIKLRETSNPASANHMLYLLSSVLAESKSKKPRKVRLTLRSDIPMGRKETARLLSPITRLDKNTELELCGVSDAVANQLLSILLTSRSGTALNDWRQLDRKVEDFLALPAAKKLGWYKAKVWRDMVLGRKPYVLDEKMIFNFLDETCEQHASQKINECRMELDLEWQEFWD